MGGHDMQPAARATRPGAPARYGVFGRYELLRRIAHGGMAELFAARMSGAGGFEKTVALKRILPELAGDRQFVAMFLDEARIAATLNHPNVVQVYDIDSVDGQYYISMEYLRGLDLGVVTKALRARQRTLPLPLALRIIMDVASGLHHAHEKRDVHNRPLGIIHRDVSPRNVFLTEDGVVKLVDFGIAKARDRLAVTRTGTVKGKFPYMAPEQIAEHAIDRRADVFSLGVLLWEVTCGRRLFTGATDYVVLRKILHQPVPRPSEVVPGYPPALERIVMRALARDPDQRTASAEALRGELEALVAELGLEAPSSGLADLVRELQATRARTRRLPPAVIVPDPEPPAIAAAPDAGDAADDDDDIEITIEAGEPEPPSRAVTVPDPPRAAAPRRHRRRALAVTVALTFAAIAALLVAALYRPELGRDAADLIRRLVG
ncbi:MAG TPA: serine/threonine-protein kinase [Kofleriaceae bacterium]|nr:serine/threonine-protein kinase [Kofleriaceae bacterium]